MLPREVPDSSNNLASRGQEEANSGILASSRDYRVYMVINVQ